MKLYTSELIRAIEPVVLVARSKAKLGYCNDGNQVGVEVGQDHLLVEARNDDCFICTKIDGTVGASTGTRITVPAKELMAGLRSFPGDATVNMDLLPDKEGRLATLSIQQRSGRSIGFVGKSPFAQLDFLTPPVDAQRVVLPKDELKSALGIAWALGDLQYKPEFFLEKLRFEPRRYRAVAGDGSRFVVLNRDGIDAVNTQHACDLQIHKGHAHLLARLLKSVEGDLVEISDWETGGKVVTRLQIGKHLLDLRKNERVKWPDERQFTDRDSLVRIVTLAEDWRDPVRAALATYSSEWVTSNRIHTSELVIDTVSRRITLTAGRDVTAVQTIPILAAKVNSGALRQLKLGVFTQYLQDMISKKQPGNFLQLEFMNERAPVVIRYTDSAVVSEDHWHSDGTGRSSHIMFCATFNRTAPPVRPTFVSHMPPLMR